MYFFTGIKQNDNDLRNIGDATKMVKNIDPAVLGQYFRPRRFSRETNVQNGFPGSDFWNVFSFI